MTEAGGAEEAADFARVEALLDAALDLPATEREAFLAHECAHDAALAQEVRSMLAAADASKGFLEATPREAPRIGRAGWQLGSWRLMQPIGTGGMGEVWLAERDDGRYEQNVAVKLLRRWNPDDTPRFLREQRLLSRLRHAGIAQLLDAGSAPDGRPYMVMEYVEGAAIVEHCDRFKLGLAARLKLFAQVCEAVAYAHRRAIVHRDLKPSNILVRGDGRPMLLDFGIARVIEPDASNATQTQNVSLTPRYAAPEQLAGGEETTQTDVYALGLLLYELLVGTLPWGELGGRAPLLLLQRSLAGPPPPPSRCCEDRAKARALRGDLDAIVLKALRPEAEDRYQSVEALSEDLMRYRTLRPVAAREGAFGYSLRRGLRRYWLVASLISLVLVSLITGLAMVLEAHRETARERDVARTEAARSKAVRDYLAHMFRDANQHARDGAPLTAKAVLERAAERIHTEFASDPAAHADVLKALGELNFYIDDYVGAEPLLRRWLASEAQVNDPVAAADVRFTLAQTLHRMGKDAEARELLVQAQAFWESDPERYSDVLLTSRSLQSQLERAAGNIEAAIATLETALPQRLARSGAVHFETAVLYNNLGAALVQADRLDQGIEALRKARDLWSALQLDGGNDALNTLNNLAAAQFRQGDLEQAETSFAAALEIRRAAHGASAATAALIGNYARVLHRRGKFDEALPLAEEAESMAVQHAGAASPLTISVRLTRTELLLAMERPLEAASLYAAIKAESGVVPSTLRPRVRAIESQLQRE